MSRCRPQQWAAAIAALAWLALPAAPRAQDTVAGTPFDQLYQQYASGDFTVVARKIRTISDLNALNPPAPLVLRKWLGTWSRAKAAYIIELAAMMSDLSSRAALVTIGEGRLYVTTRPVPLGASPGDDAFELVWHKAALGVLEGTMEFSTEELYLDTLQRRYAPRRDAPQVWLDPRFVLARAVAMEQACWNTTDAVSQIYQPAPAVSGTSVISQAPVSTPSAVAGAPRAKTHKECLSEAVRRFATASAAPAVASEAYTRMAWLQFQLGQVADGLKTIERAGPTDDQELTYWMNLFRGRLLNAANRDQDAEAAYRAAITARPSAQSANIGLALTLFRLKQIETAREVAGAIPRLPSDAVDPWWTYLGADARFVTKWLEDLRKMVLPQ
ncbi:MAG TPA: hypothetical protein VLT86_01830 [Vicinamibacterales bacterium]|nr:hypothetical protein [Vicinamibacterales bacterium]